MPATTPAITHSRRFLRKQHVAQRYGVDVRSIDRMALDGRIPKPRYLPGSRLPLWAEHELAAHERRATLTPHNMK
jgi:predicted DNA-binding transcriptional regulator AlpA